VDSDAAETGFTPPFPGQSGLNGTRRGLTGQRWGWALSEAICGYATA
jgi:hypothetical protein